MSPTSRRAQHDRAARSASTRLALAGVAAIAYTHVGYPALARIAARLRPAAPGGAPSAPPPPLTVVIPAHDEAEFIVDKLKDTWSQEYPADRLEVVVVDDGSRDGTADLAEAFPQPVTVLRQEPRRGKGAALNRGVAAASGDVVVFTDANGSLAPGSLLAISRPFADPRVAVVGGTKRPVGSGAHGEGESTYWRLESGLRTAESAFGAVVGLDGGIFAVRRSAYRPIPPGVYADDYWIPLDALRRGLAVAHVPEASATESVSQTKRDDFERRTRIAAGIWQESLTHLELAHPRRGAVAVAFVSHRVLRTGVAPALLPVTLAASALGSRRDGLARVLLSLQLLSWAAAAAGALSGDSRFSLPYQFALTNIAALRGGLRQLRRGQTALWTRTDRGPWR